MAAAPYLLQANTVFSITSAPFTSLDIGVISGEVTIDNDFYDARVWGDGASGMTEGRSRYQAIGNVVGFHDSVAAAAILADFAPIFPALGSATGLSAISMTFMTGKVFACNAHIHNFKIVGDRQSNRPVIVSWNFRSVGDFTTVTL